MSDEVTVKAVERLRSTTCGKGFCESNAFRIKIRNLESQLDTNVDFVKQYQAEVVTLKATIDKLEQYARHKESCAIEQVSDGKAVCDCGFEDLINSVTEGEK